ncbi:MAG TPA: hypothetical protein VJS85_05665, partial [Rhizomicrobium sp.]|nr:hypothetical protein [Rhizomicrobium sp.]
MFAALPLAAYLSCSLICGPVPGSRSIIERLENPKQVVGKVENGLVLDDGTQVALFGIMKLRS